LAVWFNTFIKSVGCRLGRMKLNCSQQNSIICILLVLKCFIINRFATKSGELRFVQIQRLKAMQQNTHRFILIFTKCSTTSSEAVRPTLPKMSLAALNNFTKYVRLLYSGRSFLSFDSLIFHFVIAFYVTLTVYFLTFPRSEAAESLTFIRTYIGFDGTLESKKSNSREMLHCSSDIPHRALRLNHTRRGKSYALSPSVTYSRRTFLSVW